MGLEMGRLDMWQEKKKTTVSNRAFPGLEVSVLEIEREYRHIHPLERPIDGGHIIIFTISHRMKMCCNETSHILQKRQLTFLSTWVGMFRKQAAILNRLTENRRQLKCYCE